MLTNGIAAQTMLDWLNNSMKWVKRIIDRIKMEIRYRRRLKELKKRDPFIYK